MNIKAKSYIVCLSTYNAKLTTKICRSSNQKGILSLGKKLGLKWSLISLSIIGLSRPIESSLPLRFITLSSFIWWLLYQNLECSQNFAHTPTDKFNSN